MACGFSLIGGIALSGYHGTCNESRVLHVSFTLSDKQTWGWRWGGARGWGKGGGGRGWGKRGGEGGGGRGWGKGEGNGGGGKGWGKGVGWGVGVGLIHNGP